MEVYLKGSPLSTKRGAYAVDIGPMTRETCALALIARANALHKSAPGGFAPQAHSLKVARTVSQLRDTRSGCKVILCWVWLSDESRHRAAWIERTPSNALYKHWERLPWGAVVFSTPRRQRAS